LIYILLNRFVFILTLACSNLKSCKSVSVGKCIEKVLAVNKKGGAVRALNLGNMTQRAVFIC